MDTPRDLLKAKISRSEDWCEGWGEGGGWVRQRLISEFVNSFGQGNLELSGKSQGISEISGCGIRGSDSQREDRIRFIFPARELSDIYPYTLLSL